MGHQHILLFEVNLFHPYFTDGKNIALSIAPTPDTQELIKDMRMLYRSSAGQGKVFFKGTLNADDTVDSFLDFDTDLGDFDSSDPTVFRFYIYRNDPYYLNYTHLGVDDINRKIIYLRGLETDPPGSAAIPNKNIECLAEDESVENLSIRGAKFQYQLIPDTGNAPDPIWLDIHDHRDNLVETIEVEYDAISDAYITQVDLTNHGRGKYVLKYNSREEGIYIDEYLFGRKPFAVLEIYKENWWRNVPLVDTYRTEPLNYSVTFTARKASWYYYVILKSGNHTISSTYEILDDETTDPGENRYLNGSVHLSPFVCEDVTPMGGTQIEGYSAVIFRCTTGITGDEDISYLQESKPDLTLYKDSAQLLTNLPNPDIKSTNAEIIIYV